MFHCLYAMDSSHSSLVWHLLTSWQSAWQLNHLILIFVHVYRYWWEWNSGSYAEIIYFFFRVMIDHFDAKWDLSFVQLRSHFDFLSINYCWVHLWPNQEVSYCTTLVIQATKALLGDNKHCPAVKNAHLKISCVWNHHCPIMSYWWIPCKFQTLRTLSFHTLLILFKFRKPIWCKNLYNDLHCSIA